MGAANIASGRTCSKSALLSPAWPRVPAWTGRRGMATKSAVRRFPGPPACATRNIGNRSSCKRRRAAGITRVTSDVRRPAHPQKYQQSGSPARFPSWMKMLAGAFWIPRSQRETAIADAPNCLPNSDWLSFRRSRKFAIFSDQSGTAARARLVVNFLGDTGTPLSGTSKSRSPFRPRDPVHILHPFCAIASLFQCKMSLKEGLVSNTR
jgi:hypothetical protein